MSRRRFNKPKRITPALQLFNLRKLFPDGEGQVRRNRLNWVCAIRPTPVGRSYRVRVYYEPGGQPEVFVVHPSLDTLAEGRRIPHVYSQQRAKLCLYRPRYMEWTPDRLIAETIVPWAYVWLFYFEEWLFSDDWKGGGEHPPTED